MKRSFRLASYFTLTLMMCLLSISSFAQQALRLAVAGLSHGHVDWAFNKPDRTDIELVGIYEADPELVERYATRYKLDRSLFFDKLERMLDQTKPQAVHNSGASCCSQENTRNGRKTTGFYARRCKRDSATRKAT